MESKYKDKTGRERAAIRHRRQLRQRRDRQAREAWEQGNDLKDLARAHSPISDELDADPKDAARVLKSRQQVREGKVRFWRVDGGDQKKSDAGE